MITVAVASYNHAPYIEECLHSICSQSDCEVELCWIDDASSDQSFKILEDITKNTYFSSRLAKIRIMQNTRNRGAAFTLNMAARLGSSSLISFMNSDDFYSPTRLLTLSSPHRSEDFYLGFSNVTPVGPDGSSLITDPVGERIAFDADLLIARLGSVSKALLSKQISSSTGNIVVTRKLFEKIGGFQDLKYCHDWMFMLQACRFCNPTFEPQRLYNYRLHPTNSFRSLGALAEGETNYVLSRFFEAIAMAEPEATLCPCPRREPAAFWELANETHTADIAERVFFPYLRTSRLLSTI